MTAAGSTGDAEMTQPCEKLSEPVETARMSPEKVGHRLKNLGLRTRRLTLAGNGLTFDKVTIALIEQLAAVYIEDKLLAESENLLDSQTIGNQKVDEVVQVIQSVYLRSHVMRYYPATFLLMRSPCFTFCCRLPRTVLIYQESWFHLMRKPTN